MTELMETLYDYVCDYCIDSQPESRTLRKLTEQEEIRLARLRQTLTGPQLELLEDCQDAWEQQKDLELKAMFQAAYRLAKELSAV